MQLNAKAKKTLGQAARRVAVACIVLFIVSLYSLGLVWQLMVAVSMLISVYFAWKATILEITVEPPRSRKLEAKPIKRATKNGTTEESE